MDSVVLERAMDIIRAKFVEKINDKVWSEILNGSHTNAESSVEGLEESQDTSA